MKKTFVPVDILNDENLINTNYFYSVDKKIKSIISHELIDKKEFLKVLTETWEELELMTVDCIRYFQILLKESKDNEEIFKLQEVYVPRDVKNYINNPIK